MNPLIDQLVAHDLDDTRHLIDLAKQLQRRGLPRRAQLPGRPSPAGRAPRSRSPTVLTHQVFTKEVWLAAIEGTDFPQHDDDSAAGLLARHDEIAPRWLEVVRDIDRRGAWDDRIVDALCDPPESFVLCSVVAPRAHLRRPPASAGPQHAAGRRCGRASTTATRSTGCAREYAGEDGMTRTTYYTADDARRVHRRRARTRSPGCSSRTRTRTVRSTTRSSSPDIGALVMGAHDVRVDPAPTTSAPARPGPTTSRPG